MKKLSALVIAALLGTGSYECQNANWSWARAGNGLGDGSDTGREVAADSDGNVYVTGAFPGAGITFTSASASVTLPNADTTGFSDIYLVKYDALGNVLWARNGYGPGGNDQGRSVATDGVGNVFVTGFYKSPTLTFGSYTLTNASQSGLADMFVVKYDAAGNVQWAKSYGGALEEWGMSIAADASGNAYFTGVFHSLTVVFGTVSVIQSGNGDAFVAKLDPAGAGVWAAQTGLDKVEMGVSIHVDPLANVYVAGTFESSSLGFSPNLVNAGGADVFFVKYSGNGNTLFAKSLGGAGDEDVWSISADLAGNIFLAGRYTSSPLVIGTATLTKAGLMDFYTAGFTPSGVAMWAVRHRGNVYSSPSSIDADNLGNVYVSGHLVNELPLTIGTTTLPGTGGTAGGTGGYIMKYNAASGIDLWGTTFKADPNGMDLDLYGNIHLAGDFYPTIVLGPDTLTGGVQSEVFTARMCQLPVITGTNVTACAGLTGSVNINIPAGFMPQWFASAAGGTPFLQGTGSFSSATSGTFFIGLIDTIAGCGFAGPRVAVTISVHPSASVSVSGSSLTSNFTNAVFQWYDCIYGAAVNGANGPVFLPDGSSSYAVIITVGNCVDTSDCFTYPPVDLRSHAPAPVCGLFPNPGDGHFVLRANGACTYRVSDMRGVLLKEIVVSEGDNPVDLSSLKNGIYFLSGEENRYKVVVLK